MRSDTTIPQLQNLRNAALALIAETDAPAKLAVYARVLDDARLASYRIAPHVPLSELWTMRDEIDDAIRSATWCEATQEELDDLEDQRAAILTAIQAKRTGWECVERLRLE